MATQAQIDANRRNAAKSTGPRTADGKRIVTNNALKHGLCSDEALIPGEDAETFADFADDLRLHMEEDDRSLRNVMLIERVILIRCAGCHGWNGGRSTSWSSSTATATRRCWPAWWASRSRRRSPSFRCTRCG